MTIEKKSLLSSLKTIKKANLAAAPAKKEGAVTKKVSFKTAAVNRMRNGS